MANFSNLIINWYKRHKRNLPWRDEKDPYLIWLSEIILQQTQVNQGLSYYLKFKSNFPSVQTLAESDQEKVLKLWQGLGYYSRARNLHHAAKQVVNEHNGVFPESYIEILKLKGVGEYTAAAISSFAFNEKQAVVDGNVFRVLSRVFKIATPINTGKGKKEFFELANRLISAEEPAEHNQAIMEVGALVCKPKTPDCVNCPVQEKCLSFADGTQLNYPVKEKKLKIKDRYLNYAVVTDGSNLLIKKRTGKGIWQGLYDFPLLETEKSLEKLTPFDGIDVSSQQMDMSLKHILTHQRLYVKFWIVNVESVENQQDYLKIPIMDIKNYPCPQLIARYIDQSHFFKR